MSILRIQSNVDNLTANLEVLSKEVASGTYAEGVAAFRDIRDILMAGLKTNIGSFAGTPLSPVTREYKARKGLDSRPLVASGNTMAGIDGRYGGNFAKAMRGEREWYIFLHDRGRGYSFWSVDGARRSNKTGTRKARRERNRPGTTPFPERRTFVITPDVQSKVVSRLTEAIDQRLARVGAS